VALPASPNQAQFLHPGDWSAIASRLHLSGREAQVVRLILCDEAEGAIADQLGISVHTVHTHLERLYRKLNVTSRCQVVIRVFQEYVALEASRIPPDTARPVAHSRPIHRRA